MKKLNCWEHMKCGRHPGGHSAADSGVCPVSIYDELNGVHGGKNAGRACWTIDNSLCPELMRETPPKKFSGCWKCDFYHSVKNEELSSPHGFITTYREMKKIREKHCSADGVAPNNTSEVHTQDALTGHSHGCRGAENDTANSRSSDSSCDQKS